MSRGGRGGFRGGRRGPMSNLPWEPDPSLELDSRPSELFPAYDVPQAAQLSKKEDKQVSYFLLFREQVHEGPLYTHARTWNLDPNEPSRVYGQEQINKRYGIRSKATEDPFLCMPTYSERFTKEERSLPDLASLPFAKEFFPPELHATLDGAAGPAAKRRRTAKKALVLSNITSLRTAEDIFLSDAAHDELADQDRQQKTLQVLDRLDNEEGGDDVDLDDDDWIQPNGVDGDENAEAEDEYEDESDDDYNAEQYFEDNQPDDDYDEGGDGGGDEYF